MPCKNAQPQTPIGSCQYAARELNVRSKDALPSLRLATWETQLTAKMTVWSERTQVVHWLPVDWKISPQLIGHAVAQATNRERSCCQAGDTGHHLATEEAVAERRYIY